MPEDLPRVRVLYPQAAPSEIDFLKKSGVLKKRGEGLVIDMAATEVEDLKLMEPATSYLESRLNSRFIKSVKVALFKPKSSFVKYSGHRKRRASL